VTRLRERLDAVLGGALAALMGLAVLNVVWQVVSRFVLGSPSAFTDELARYLLVWIGLLGAAWGVGRRIHVAVDLLPRRLPPRLEAGLARLVLGVVFAFGAAVMVFGGLGLVALSFELGQTSAALGLPLGVVYLALPLAGLAVCVYTAADWLDGRGDRPS
jgi:TRAP-type C4-dicarboxylate transport system permease small subunit